LELDFLGVVNKNFNFYGFTPILSFEITNEEDILSDVLFFYFIDLTDLASNLSKLNYSSLFLLKYL
jgi:hypothetical protein